MVHVHFTQASPIAPLQLRLLHYDEFPMPPKVKRRVLRLIKENKTTPEEMAIVNIQLGQVTADAIRSFARTKGFSLKDDVDLIAGQGATLSWTRLASSLTAGHHRSNNLALAAPRAVLWGSRASPPRYGRNISHCRADRCYVDGKLSRVRDDFRPTRLPSICGIGQPIAQPSTTEPRSAKHWRHCEFLDSSCWGR